MTITLIPFVKIRVVVHLEWSKWQFSICLPLSLWVVFTNVCCDRRATYRYQSARITRSKNNSLYETHIQM